MGVAIFLNGTFDEAFDLLVEARDYLAYVEPIERGNLAPEERLILNCEAMRLTSRLTQVMAWLLMQKAVSAGEISSEEAAAEEHRLNGQAVCRSREFRDRPTLPPRLGHLLDRSYNLYDRVERLDQMAASRAH